MLVFGGESSEHDVSIAGAHNVYAALDDEKYDISLCYIDRSGVWWLVDSVDEHENAEVLHAMLGNGGWITDSQKEIKPDVVLPILHGKGGEDGSVQGLCQLLHIPIVGPSLLSAAVTMNKDMTKRLLRDCNVPVVPWQCWLTYRDRPDYANIVAKLGPTLFVKPSRAGSSVGVSKVTDSESFTAALDLAAQHDDMVLIESAVDGREIEIAVLGSQKVGITRAGEILPGEEFYSYEDKYAPNSASKVNIPAELDEETSDLLRKYALLAFQAVAGVGMARIDFFVTHQGEIYLNEINSIPGFTNISMYPKLWRFEGITYPNLIDNLIKDALTNKVY